MLATTCRITSATGTTSRPPSTGRFIADVLALFQAPPTITVADAGLATSPATATGSRDKGL